MTQSSERILTTHTGSLPREKGLTEPAFRKQEGKAVDAGGFEAGTDCGLCHVRRARDGGSRRAWMQLAALSQGAAEASERLWSAAAVTA